MLTLHFNPFPILHTERLVLRPISLEDAAGLFLLRSDSRVMQFIDRPLAKTIEDASTLIKNLNDLLEKNEAITWAISLQSNPGLIGTIGFWNIAKEHYRAEIGYLLSPDFQGMGIMQEAIRKAIQYGFHTMNLHSMEAIVNPQNQASIRLLEKCGFMREAYFKENYYFDGKFLDSAIYSLIYHEKN
ncbi:MAG: GNAT family N-acetyltransferase [Chitinophagales bacterium]